MDSFFFFFYHSPSKTPSCQLQFAFDEDLLSKSQPGPMVTNIAPIEEDMDTSEPVAARVGGGGGGFR